jgi:hypothetical protein
MRVQYVGYEPQDIFIRLENNQRLNIGLKEKSFEIGNVVVTGERADRNISRLTWEM